MRAGILLTAIVCGLGLAVQAVAAAVEHFDIPAGDLLAALDLLARQSHVEFIYSADDLRGLRTPGVQGDLTAEAAVRQVLEGTGLSVNVHPDGSILIGPGRKLSQVVRPQPPHPRLPTAEPDIEPPIPSEEVLVTGTASGLVATRTETPLREIPQTVSLITREQIRQQNDTDLAQALTHTPGITVVRTDSLDEEFYSRGFKVTSFHVDGGAA